MGSSIKERTTDTPNEVRFPNSVNVNYYGNQNKYVGWHADDEKIMKKTDGNPLITSISLGATRIFDIGLKPVVNRKQSELVARERLESGDLLTMEGGCQETHVHTLPKSREPSGGRFGLTYRYIEDCIGI